MNLLFVLYLKLTRQFNNNSLTNESIEEKKLPPSVSIERDNVAAELCVFV